MVSAACTNYCATPSPPVVTNPTASTLDIAIAAKTRMPTSTASEYPPRLVPASSSFKRTALSADTRSSRARRLGARGPSRVWPRIPNTLSKFAPAGLPPADCPSAWSTTTSERTAVLVRTIDYTKTGIAVNKGIAGMNDLPWHISAQRQMRTTSRRA